MACASARRYGAAAASGVGTWEATVRRRRRRSGGAAGRGGDRGSVGDGEAVGGKVEEMARGRGDEKVVVGRAWSCGFGDDGVCKWVAARWRGRRHLRG